MLGVLTLFSSSCSLHAGPSSAPTKIASQTTIGRIATSLPFSQPFDWTRKRITILPAENWGLFKERENVIVETPDKSLITVFDLYGKTVYSSHSPALLNLRCGHYFVQSNGDRIQFAVLPNDYVGASFLGANAVTNVPWGDFQKQQRMGVQWVRTVEGALDNVRPQSNRWAWSNMDAIVAANAGRKIIAIAADGPVPPWIQPSQLVNVYTNFVDALTQRYKGKLTAIEFWNEPAQGEFYNNPNWLQTLAQLTIHGATAIRAVDPTIQVMAPTWNWSADYTEMATLAQLRATPFIDVLTWHDYESYNYPPDQDVSGGFSNVLTRIALYRQAAQVSGPLAITELGLWGDSALGMSYGWAQTNWPAPPVWTVAMARTIKQTVMYRAGGAEILIPQCLVNGSGFSKNWASTLGGWEYDDRGPAPKTSAFLMTCHWLNSAKFVGYEHNGSLWKFHWLRHDQPMTFVWSEEVQENSLADRAVRVTDIFGNSLVTSQITPMPFILWGEK